ncbi:MAG: V-type ATPase 116kDa subunit family protein [Spirochaetia bacterium]
MITTTAMRQLFAVILEKDKDAVTRTLLDTGVIHFIDIRELSSELSDSLKEHHPEGGGEKAKELRRRLEGYFQSSGVDPSRYANLHTGDKKNILPSRAEEKIEELASKVRKIRDKQKDLQNELLRLKELERRLPSDGLDYTQFKGKHSFLSVRFGTVRDEKRDTLESALKDFPSVYIRGEGSEDERIDYLLTLRRDETKISELLGRIGWEEREPPKDSGEDRELKTMSASRIREKQQEIYEQQKELEERAAKVVADRAEELSRLWATLRIGELSFEIEKFYKKTDRTYLLSGWIPKERTAEVTEAIMGSCEGRCRIEWHNPADAKDPEVSRSAPVQMHNPKVLSPFQKLVENYAVPAYGTVDPTPFVAVFYLAMFGLMFGDVGHGAVVLLAGLLGRRVSRKRGKDSMLFPLFIWCGSAAIVTGVLFGSYFGTSLFPPVWFDYHGVVAGHGGGGAVESITDVLLITIYFGITVISVGLLLNWINRIRRKDWFGLVWKEGGLIVGWLYAAGTYSAFYFVRHDYRELPGGEVLMLLLGLPALILGVKPYLERRRETKQHHRKNGESVKVNPAGLAMEWLVELLEIFSGYLSNTLSFMRVAGLGIAHASLMIAFFQIADMAATEGGTYTLASYLVLFVGNALVIGLEGLSAGVQSLRLNYYEFFSKYFSGTGKAYSPVSLKGGFKDSADGGLGREA